MATKSAPIFQRRKTDILAALDMLPLTTKQLLSLSETFERPFKDESTLRHYLRSLRGRDGGMLVQSFPYAIETDGRPPVYFKLTRAGYRQLYGPQAAFPNRRYFERIRPLHHEHSKAIADFMVKTIVSGLPQGMTLQQYARENSVRIEVADQRPLWPDSCFTLRDQSGRTHNFVLELDNGTERIQSKANIESIRRKIDGYDAHQSQYDARDPQRYFVLFVTTRTLVRVQHIIAAANQRMRTPERCVFLATDLQSYLRCKNPFQHPCFIDNTGRHRPLVKMKQEETTVNLSTNYVTSPFAMC